MELRFLDLPLEMQHEIISHISRVEDLKALCLVSQYMYDLVRLELYCHLDLGSWEDYIMVTEAADFSSSAQDRLLARIDSLLLNGRRDSDYDNLLLVRTLSTDCCDLRVTEAMDAVLARLRHDSLVRFDFSNFGADHFPTPEQMEYLWTYQSNIENLMSTHIIPTLANLLSTDPLKTSRLLRSVTELELRQNMHEDENDQPSIRWPLEHLDLSRLRLLSILSWSPTILAMINSLFSNRLLPNLERLGFIGAIFPGTLQLMNCPALHSLSLAFRPILATGSAPLDIPQNLPLKLLSWAEGPIDHLVPVLTRIQGLEALFVRTLKSPITMVTDSKCEDLAAAIELHKKTLHLLVIEDEFLRNENGSLNVCILEAMKKCTKLRRLGVPLGPEYTIAQYKCLIESLPSLVALLIFSPFHCRSHVTAALAHELMEAISVSSKLAFLGFSDFHNCDRDHKKLDHNLQCFERRKLGMRAECAGGAETSAIPIRPGSAIALFNDVAISDQDYI